MKSLMLKLLIITLTSSLTLFAATKDETKVADFFKNSLHGNKNFTLKDVSISATQKIENLENWKAYFVKISLHVKAENKDVDIDDIVFSNGEFLTKELFNLSLNEDVKHLVAPSLKDTLHDKKHLIEGSLEAKTKFLVFSDPYCPFCVSFMPIIIEFVRKYPNDFGLYYYHLPLTTIHPSAPTLIKAMEVAKEKGVEDVIYRTYKQKFKNSRDKKEKVLKDFNDFFKLNISMKELETKKMNESLQNDIKVSKEMMVRGTPTLFVNGKLDPKREKLLEFIHQYEGKKK